MAQIICQKCRTPLRIDGTIEDLNPASFKILADAAPTLETKEPEAPRSAAAKERRRQYGEVSEHAGAPIHRRQGSAGQHAAERPRPDMSYIMLTESQVAHDVPEDVPPPTARGKQTAKMSGPDGGLKEKTVTSGNLDQTLRLFKILSSRSDIDFPVCSECTELLLDGLQKRQAGVIKERDAYVQFLKQAREDIPTDEERAKTKKDLEDAQRREKQALQELEALEAEKARMEDEIAALDLEADKLDEEEESFWHERNAFTAEVTAFQAEHDRLQNQLAYDTKVHEGLKRTNVYNDTFCIGHDGQFGTINGLRLGRLPECPVDWSEINAAWGQALLLVSVVAERLDFKLKGWKLHPIGSTSKIEKVDQSSTSSTPGKPKGATFDLFTSGDVPLSFGFLHRSFDSGMVAFLDCLRQLSEHVEATPPELTGGKKTELPYKVVKDRIGDFSIKLGNFGQDEHWTRACKLTLTCCKFLLAHTSSMASRGDVMPAR